MTPNAALQCVLYLVLLVVVGAPLGAYMARVYEGQSKLGNRLFGPLERFMYRVARIPADIDMSWQRYAGTMLAFNLFGALIVYVLERMQHVLPLNPAGLPGVGPAVAFNTAVSFVTNTNWQAYGGETTMSYLTQMAALTVQNFVSAATGMAVLVALIRGIVRRNANGIGSFWVDVTRSITHILLPLSVILAVLLVSQGVVQTFGPPRQVSLVQPLAANGSTVSTQTLVVGPVASQVAIKQLGTNGGGYYNANSAHPFENPTPISNLLEMLAILLIPAALCFTFGAMVRDRRQGIAILAAMLIIFVPLMVLAIHAEQAANPALARMGADAAGGNMEGKEVRFGITNSALWATATTAASNGSVNAMHDSFMPLGGLVPMWLMQLGEVVFGGVGSGLYGMLMFAIVAVFIAGLMVGRTPEYLGKKIEAHEMKMASLAVLVPLFAALVGTALACVVPETKRAVANPGMHGFGEILYAFSSSSNNNGSAFAGLTASGMFYATAQGITMLMGRYWIIVPVLAIAGSLARKKYVPPSVGTLPTHTPLFVFLLVGVVIIIGALTFFPALALGPIVEHLALRTM
ncbi:MAG TPA: potassium-transporting ATPase subunit KdpA [Candidatus Krumholzibacteria bacterium]|nr:potassium-transporting ATPase subunit KdpA [Candidatus Krumholzibacteria bacterium]